MGPLPCFDCPMAFDPMRGETLLFQGGMFTPAAGTLTWLWDGVVWRQPALALEPPPRNQAAMAFDERRGVMVLFGGWVAIGLHLINYLGDTWEWNGNAWLQRTPLSAFPAGPGQLTWDAARERIVLFQGNVVYDWDGVAWQLRTAATVIPPPRDGNAFAYDGARERLVLFGGHGNCGDMADVWELGPVQPARVTTFGSGCAGTLAVPMLDVVAARGPWLGDAITLRLSPVMDGAAALFALGRSNTQWNGAPLPASLGGLGMAGCTLHVALDATFAATGSGGMALLTATVPTVPALLGVSMYLQGGVHDPGANAAGIVVSNALALVVGAR